MDLLSPVPEHQPVQFCCADSVSEYEHGWMERWDGEKNRAGRRWGWRWRRLRWMEGAKRQINLFKHYLQRVLSLPEDVSKCGRIGGRHRAAGRWEEKRGENIWHTLEGGGGARESLEDAERRGGNKAGEGEKRQMEYNGKEMHVFILFLVKSQCKLEYLQKSKMCCVLQHVFFFFFPLLVSNIFSILILIPLEIPPHPSLPVELKCSTWDV